MDIDIFLDQANTSVAIIGVIAHTMPTDLNISSIISNSSNLDNVDDLRFVSDIKLTDTTIYLESNFQQIAQTLSNKAAQKITQNNNPHAVVVVPNLKPHCLLEKRTSRNESMLIMMCPQQQTQLDEVGIISDLAITQSKTLDYNWFKIFSDLYSLFSEVNAFLKNMIHYQIFHFQSLRPRRG